MAKSISVLLCIASSVLGVAACDGGRLPMVSRYAPLTGSLLAQPAYALCAMNDVDLSPGADVFTYDVASGLRTQRAHIAAHGNVRIDRNAHVEGYATSCGNLALEAGGVVGGGACVGGAASVHRRAFVLGGITYTRDPPLPCGDLGDLDQLFASVAAQNDNQRLRDDPGLGPYFVDGGLDVPANTRFTVPAGTYDLAFLRVGQGTVLELKGTNTLVSFVVRGEVVVGGKTELEAHPGLHEMWIISRETATITLGSGSTTVARIYAPNADVVFARNARALGAITAKNIALGDGALVRYSGPESDVPADACPITDSPIDDRVIDADPADTPSNNKSNRKPKKHAVAM